MTVVLPPTTAYFGEADAPGTGNIALDSPSPIIFHNSDFLIFHNDDNVVFHEQYQGGLKYKFSVPRTVYSGEVEL